MDFRQSSPNCSSNAIILEHLNSPDFADYFRQNRLSLIKLSEIRARHFLDQAQIESTSGLLLLRISHSFKDDPEGNFVPDMSELILFNQNAESLHHHLGDENIYAKDLRSPMRGVSIHSSPGLWRARKKLGGVCEHLGYHASDIAASMAYKLGSSNSKPFEMSATEVAQMRILINDGSSVNSVLQKVTHVASQKMLFNNEKLFNLKMKHEFKGESDKNRKKMKLFENSASDFEMEIPLDHFEPHNIIHHDECKSYECAGTCTECFDQTIFDFDVDSVFIINGGETERGIADDLFNLIWK